MEKLNSLMQLMIYQHYWQLFFKSGNFKYTTTSQKLTFFLVVHFLSHRFLSCYLFSNSHAQRNLTSTIYITYRILWVLAMYIVPEICIGGCFLEDCFYCINIYYANNLLHFGLEGVKIWKSEKSFKVIDLVVFQQLRKLWKK